MRLLTACLLLALGLTLGMPRVAVADAAAPESITVVIDDHYPPFTFRDGNGELVGIAVDKWRLWEKATGVKVAMVGMDWRKVLARMADGEADVIDTISLTEGRARLYDFSEPYSSVEVPIFFQKNVGGVSDAGSLQGFTVGVKDGSACAEWLSGRGIHDFAPYHSAEALIDAAAQGRLKVFCLDKPNALYFLYKKDLDQEFRYTDPLYTAQLRWAVRKGSPLREFIAAGFDKVPAAALKDVERKWIGSSLYRQQYIRTVEIAASSALAVAAVALALFLWNAFLRRRVAAGTAELTATAELLARSNAELEASRREMAEIISGIDLARDCVTVTDAERRILFTNRASLEGAGTELEAVRGRRVGEFKDHPDFLRVLGETDVALDESGFWEGEVEWVRPVDGTRIIYDVRRSRLPGGGTVVVSTDVSERKRAERELITREREAARILAAVNLSRDRITVTDDQNRILFANRAAIETSGLPPEIADVRGLRWSDFQTHPNFRATVLERDLALARDGYWEGEFEWIRPVDGRAIFFFTRQSRLPGGGSVIVSTDITDRKRLEEERRQHDQREAQASKMEALGQLAGGVAHDFNNLLGAILGFAHFIVQDTDPASPPHHFAERIITAGQRGRSLVQQILAFSRRSLVEPAAVPLAEVVAETQELLRATLPSTTLLTVFNRAPGAAVLADRGRLSQMLINLCVNASDALAGETGQVYIGIELIDRKRPELARLPIAEGRPSPVAVETWRGADDRLWIATGGLPIGDCVSVTVTDGGEGIPDEVAPRIFDPFFTTKEKGRGTGLGLAVIHTIVTEHGGAALVHTRKGAGTAFELILPLTAAPAETGASSVSPVADPGGATVLLVDDDSDFCEMMRTALERQGHEVVATNDPLEALRAITDDPDIWDLLFTDQTMPNLKGRDLVTAAKAVSPALRCVICTGYSSSMNEQDALAAGADGFLLKPVDMAEVTALVGRLTMGGGGVRRPG